MIRLSLPGMRKVQLVLVSCLLRNAVSQGARSILILTTLVSQCLFSPIGAVGVHVPQQCEWLCLVGEEQSSQLASGSSSMAVGRTWWKSSWIL